MDMFSMARDILVASALDYGDTKEDEQIRIERDFEDIGEVMSNFDHAICVEAAAKLKSGKFYGEYPAWNFWSLVWFEDGLYHCYIKQYRCHVETITAKTLEEIMEQACSKYGSD